MKCKSCRIFSENFQDLKMYDLEPRSVNRLIKFWPVKKNKICKELNIPLFFCLCSVLDFWILAHLMKQPEKKGIGQSSISFLPFLGFVNKNFSFIYKIFLVLGFLCSKDNFLPEGLMVTKNLAAPLRPIFLSDIVSVCTLMVISNHGETLNYKFKYKEKIYFAAAWIDWLSVYSWYSMVIKEQNKRLWKRMGHFSVRRFIFNFMGKQVIED